MPIKDRIKELRRVPANTLLANPKNWRGHPPSQRAAMRGVLEEIGFADAILVRETPDGLMICDGHLRTDLMGRAEVPVLVLDLDDREADQLLATLDPLAAMASADQEKLLTLLEDTRFNSEAVNAMLEALANGERYPMPELGEMPFLSDGDKSDIGQMNFTVTEAQRDTIEAAISMAKGQGASQETGNENSNGNALALVCETFTKNA